MNAEERYSKMISEAVTEAVALAKRRAALGAGFMFRIAIRETTEAEKGDIALLLEMTTLPAGWIWHGGSDRLRMHIPYDQYFRWLYDRCRGACVL